MATILTLQWAKQNAIFNTTAAVSTPIIAVDLAQNAYVAYSTDSGTASGGSAVGGNDIIVFKIDSSGNTVWTQQGPNSDTSGNDTFPSIAVDSDNKAVYVAYQTTGDISGGRGKPANTQSSIVLLRIDTDNGTVVWAMQLPVSTAGTLSNPTNDQKPRVAIDSSGSVYLTYSTNGKFTESGADMNNANIGSTDIVVIKVEPISPGVIWGQQLATFNTTVGDSNPSIAIDPVTNNVIIAYTTYGATSGNTNTADSDIAVFKLDTDGVLQWIKQNSSFNGSNIGSPPNLNSTPSVACDSAGNICVSYASQNTLVPGGEIGGNGNTIIVFKMDSMGNTLWANQNIDFNLPLLGNTIPSIAVDGADNIFVSFTDTVVGGSPTYTSVLQIRFLVVAPPIYQLFSN